MDNNLSIQIIATLNQSLSLKEINTAISKIETDPALKKLNINIGVTDTQINNVVKQIASIQEKLKGTTTKPIPLIDPEQEAKLKNSLTTIDQAIAKVKDLGTVKISNDQINPLTGEVEKFTLTVTKGRDEIAKFKYELASLNGLVIGGQENQLFVPTKNSSVNNADANILKQIQQEQQNELKLEQQLIDLQDKFTQSLKKTYDQGLLTDEVFQQFSTSINGAKNIEQLNLIQNAIQRTIQVEKNLAQQQDLINKSQILMNSGKIGDTTGLQTLISNLSRIDPASTTATRDLSLLRNELNNISASAKLAGESSVTFGSAMKEAFAPMTMYFGGFALFMQGINSIKSGISYINDLNHSLTTIAMITHQNQDQVAALGQQYQQLGSQLSVSTTEIAASAAELIRQGLSMDEVNSRLKLITEFSRVAGISAQDATTYITAATNSMQISAQKASDTFALLGHVSGVNAAYIATAFQKVGGTAGALGLDFQKVASWITTEGERTKESAETIGQSIKSIMARIQSMREKGFDESDGTKVNTVAKALASVNIQLMDNQGQFRDFGKVMDELGAKWGSLDSRQRAYLATTVAGTYQQSRFLDLMQGYSRSIDLYKQSLDSAGTTQSKFNEWQQGTEAQIAKLTNTMQGFWMSAFNSKDVQLAVAGLNSIASGLKNVTDAFGFLPTVLGIATAAILTFNTKAKESFATLVTNVKTSVTEFNVLSTSLVRAGDSMVIGSTGSKLLQTGLYNLTLVGRGAALAFDTIAASIKGVAISLATTALPVVAIMAVSYGIEKLAEAIANQKAQEEALQKQTQNTIDAYSNHKSKIDDLIKTYEKLSDQQQNGGLTADKQQQYVDVQNQLAKILPAIKDGEDAKGNATLKSSKAIKEQIDLLKEQIQLEKDQKKNSTPSDIKNSVDDINKSNVLVNKGGLQQQLDYSKKQSDRLEEQLKVLKDSKATKSSIADLEGQITTELTKQQNLQDQINSKNKTIAGSIKNYFSDSKINTDAISQISTALSTINLKGKSENEIDTMFSSITDSVTKLNTALKDDNQKAVDAAEKKLESYGVKSEAVQAIIDALTNAQNKNTKATKDNALSDGQLAKDLQDAKGNYSDLLNVMKEYAQAQEYNKAISIAQGEAYTTLSDTLSPVNKLLEDMANGQTISASAAMDLISKNQDLAKYISITGDQVQINTQGIVDWRDAQISSYNDAIKAVEQESITVANATLSDLKNYDLQIKTIKNVADAKQALAEINKIQAETDGMGMSGQTASDNLDKSKKAIQDILDIEDQISKVQSLADSGLKETGTSLDKTSTSTQKSTYVTDQYKNSIDALNESLKKLQSETNNYAKGTKEYEDALQRQINLLQQQKDLTDAQAKSLQQQIASGNIIQTGMITSKSSSSSSGSSNYNYASGGSTQAQIWNFFKGKGLSDGAIAGIMGNLQQESGFNTTARNSNGATGLAQWMGGRLSSLQSQSNWSSLDTQLNFLWSEWAPMMSNYGASAFNNSDPTQAAYIFEKLFERSGGDANTTRQKYASNIYSQFAGKGGTYSGATSSSGVDTSKSAADAAQAIDQAKANLLQLQDTSQGYADQMQQLKLQIIEDRASVYDNLKKTYESQISQYDYLQSVQDKNSANWLHTQMNREAAYNQEISLQQQSIDYLKQQIQYNTDLTESQKQTLSDDVLNRQKDLLSLEQKLYDTRNQMATDIVDTYKQALTDMKDAATKSIDNMINDINKQADQASYKKKLTDAQQSAQDIQNQITQLSLDDSTAAKKKVADLQKQLTTQNDSITQMVSDNDKQQRIDNLNTQKQNISDYYDNMLNDEQKFGQMRSDILNLNNQGIINDLNSFSTTIQKNVNILGTSVVNTIIDMVNRANGYMNLSTANSSVIGHIASLDSGGLLPSWGSSGKLLLAHEKEMILNKTDTSNFLKAINLTRDFFSNIVKMPDMSSLKMNPAIAGCNTVYNLNFNIDKVTGDANGAKTLFTQLVNGIKSKGGNI